jgi:magnesium-protoporphyrin IX monomethyl ester (oxidative) cyclase
MLEEIKTIQEPYIYFVCEESLLDPKLSLALAKAIKEEGINKNFGMPLRSDTISKRPHVIEAWAEAGLTDTIVGIEQATDEHMVDREKTTTIQNNVDAMRILKANGVNCTGSMFFRPDFTQEQFDQLVAHTVEIEVDCPQYFILTPIPGTKLYKKSENELVEHNFDLWDFNHAVTPTKLPLKKFYEQYMLAYATHLRPFAVEFYQRKFANLTQEEMLAEVKILEVFREVFGTLHLDHQEYKGPDA